MIISPILLMLVIKSFSYETDFEELYKDNQKILDDIHYHQNKIKESEEKILNAVNTVESHKIPLNSTIESKVTVLRIVDEGMARIPQQGPPLNAKPLNTKDHHNHDHNNDHHNHDHN